MKALRDAISKNPSLCDKFLENPSINPVSNREIKFGAQTYNDLVELCGEPNKDIINRSFASSKKYSISSTSSVLAPSTPKSPVRRQTFADISGIAFTGNPDTDKQILLNLDPNTLNKVETNKYIYNLLNDNNFWRNRLEQRLRLISNDPDLNYEFIVKYLDNGKSFKENFESAIIDGYPEIIKILLDNDVIDAESSIYIAIHYNNFAAFKLLVDKFPVSYAIIYHIFYTGGNYQFIKILVPKLSFKDILNEFIKKLTYYNNYIKLFNVILSALLERDDIDQEIVKNMLKLFQNRQYSKLKQYIYKILRKQDIM